jgi:antirestriction protein ArdC/DNA polymerase III epsilon subunit-like protein
MQNKIIVSSYRAYSSREQARFIRQEANLLIEKANEFSTTSRRVNRRSAYKVLARSLQKTRGLPFSIRKHQALTELSNYISLAKYNKVVGLEAFNTDLLPTSHPRSTRMNSMTASALAEAQMRWVLDDPRIKDETVKSLLASAMFSPIDSPEHKYSMIRLENLPQGQVPVEVLLAAANPFAGKNSAAARRAREAVQLSDRFERWINMGRSLGKRATDGFRVYVKRNDGSTRSLSGELLNQNMFDPNLVDIEMGKGKVATVPTKLGEGLEAFIKSKDSVDGYSSVEAEVPNGAQVLPESSIVVSDAPSIYRKDEGNKYTDDKYDIVKFDNPKAAQTAISDGQKRAAELDKPEPKLLKKGEVDPDSGKQFWDIEEPVFGVYRRGKNTPLAFAQSWKDVNNEILRDEPNLDEDEGREYTRPEPQTADDNVPLLDQADDIFKPTKKKADKKKKKEASSFPYEVPDRAYEFNPNEEYTPEFDFDDPVTIANDQMPEELEDALLTAVEPVSDTEKATGYAPISFTDGREQDVPAEAIAAAIREQGGDAEMALAQAYDKVAGNNNNEKALLESRGDKEPVIEEAPVEDGEIEPSPSDKIIEDEILKPETKKSKSKKPISEEEPIAEIVDEGEERYVPPLLKSLSEEELAGYKKDGDYRPFLPKNADLDTPEGLYKLDPNPVDPAENLIPKAVESEYPFYNAVNLANDNTTKDLTSKLEDAIRGTGPQGPGFGELDISDPNLETSGAPVSAEALRDALQLQGKDTDAIIEKINKKAGKAKAKIKPPVSEEPEVEPDTKEEEVKPKKAVTYKRSGNRTLLRAGAGGAFKDKEIADFLDENGFEWTGTIERDGKTLPVNSESASQTDEEFKAFARELRDRFGIDLQPRPATAKSPAQEPIDIDAPAPEPEVVPAPEPEAPAPSAPTPEVPSVEETPKEEVVVEEKLKYTKKRPEDLKPGDEVYIPGVGWRIVTSVSERKFDDKDQPSIWTVEYTDGNPYYPKTGKWKTRKDWLNDDGTEVDQTLFTRDPLGIPGDETPTSQQVVIQTEAPEGVDKPKAETEEETPTPEPTTRVIRDQIAGVPDEIDLLPAGTRAISKDLKGRKQVWIKQEDGSWVNIKTGEIVDKLPTPVQKYGGEWWNDYEFTRPENLGGEEVADDDDSDLVDEVIIDSVLDEEKPAPTVDDFIDRVQQRRKLTRAERKALKKEKKHRQQMLIKIIDSNFGPGSFDLDFAERRAVKAMLFDLDSMTTEELEDISRAVNAELGWEFIKNLPDKPEEPEQEVVVTAPEETPQEEPAPAAEEVLPTEEEVAEAERQRKLKEIRAKKKREREDKLIEEAEKEEKEKSEKEKPTDLSGDKKKVLKELVAERRKIQDAIDEADLSDEVKPEEKKALKDALDELTSRIDEIVLSTPDEAPKPEPTKDSTPAQQAPKLLKGVTTDQLKPGDVLVDGHFTITKVEREGTKKVNVGGQTQEIPAYRITGYYPNSVEQSSKLWSENYATDLYRGATPPAKGDLPELNQPKAEDYGSEYAFPNQRKVRFKDRTLYAPKNAELEAQFLEDYAKYDEERIRRQNMWEAPKTSPEAPSNPVYATNIPASEIQVGDIAFRFNKFGAREFFTVTKVVGTVDGVTTIEGHYVGHQTQTKEWRSGTSIDVIRGETNLPQAGDKEPLDRPDKSLPNYGQLEKERQAKIALADQGYKFNAESPMSKVSKPKLPPFYGFVELLLDNDADGASIQKALDEKGFIVFDFETLGNDVQNVLNPDAPIQAAAVKYVDGKKVDELNIYINPGQPLGSYYYETDESGNRVLKANRMLDAEGNPITDEWLATQPDLKEQLQKLVDFFGDKPILVGQNVDFDINVLQRWAQKLDIDFKLTSAVDTLGIAKILQNIERSTVEFPENPKEGDQAFSSAGNPWTWTLDKNGKGRWAAPSNALNQLAKRLGIEVNSSGFHNALFDVEVTEKVLRKLLENVKAGDLPIGGTVAYANEFKKWMESLASQKQVKTKREADKIASDIVDGKSEGTDLDSIIEDIKSVEEENVTIVDGEESADEPKVYISPLYNDTINEDWVKDPENTDFIPNPRVKDLKIGDFIFGSVGELLEVIKFEDDEARPSDFVRVIRVNLNNGQTLSERQTPREDGGTGWFLNKKLEGGAYRRKDNADKSNAQIETETIEAIEDVEPVLIPEEKPVKGEEVTPEQAETVVNDAIDVITTSKPDSSIEEAVKGLNVDETVKEQVIAEPEAPASDLIVGGSPFHISADGVTPVKPGDKVIHAKTKRVGFVSVLLDKYNKKYTNYVKVRYEDTGEREPVASKNLSIIYSAPEAGSISKPVVDDKSVAEIAQKIRDLRTDSSVEYELTPEELAQKIADAQLAREAQSKEVNFVKTSENVVNKLKENLPVVGGTLNSVPSLKTGELFDVNFAFDKPTVKELEKSSKELNIDSEDDLIVFRAGKDGKFLRNQPIATIKPDGSIIWKREEDKTQFSLDVQKVLQSFENPVTNISAMIVVQEPEDNEGTDEDNYGNGTLLGESESSFDYNNISKFPPTKEQRSIVDAIMTGKDVVVQALAGTGKTSTLVLAAKRILAERPKSNLLYIVFNKETAEEAQGRMPENVDSRTMDNIVYSMLPSDYKDRNKLNDKPKIGERSLIDFTDNVNLFDYYKFEPITVMIRGTETTLGRNELVQELREVINRFAISGDETLTEKHFKKPAPFFDTVPKVLLDYAQRMWTDVSTTEGWDPTSKKLSRIDYSDMLKAWALTNPQFADGLNSGSTSTKPFKGRKNDLFFFDEAQDMNPVIVKLLANQKGIQRVYVGDSNQAIYAFRGAVDELNNIRDAVELYLTQTFRFGDILAGIGNRFLTTLGSKKKIVGKPGEDDGEIVDNMQDPDAIIARTNGGVIDAVFDMLAKGKNPGLNLETYYKALSYARSAQWLMAANKGTPAYKKPKIHEDLAGFNNWNEVLKAVQDGKSVGGAMYMVRLLRDRRMSVKDLVDKLNSITPIRGTGFRTDEYVPLGMDAVKVGTTGKLGKGKLNSGYLGDLTYTVKDGFIEFENAKSYQDFLLKEVTYVDREYTKKDGTLGTYKVPAVAFQKGQEEEMLTLINDVRRWVQNYAPRIPIDSEVITAHKSKGKEWDRVLLWDDFKEPEINDEGEMELPSPEERRISYVAATRAKKAIDIGDSLKWVYDVTSEEDEKAELTEVEKLLGMTVNPDPDPVTPEEIGTEVVKARKITDQKTLEVANRLIDLMKQGVVPWTKGWSGGGFLPTNAKSNKAYQGTNTLALWAAMHLNDWTDPRFLTFNQGKALGGYVRKGETGTKILKPNVVTKEVKQPDGSIKKEGYIYFTEISVFNVSQFEKLDLPPLVKKDPVPVLDIETKILESYKDHPEIIYRPQDGAFYRPSEDKIYLPLREQFDTSQTFIETLFHELGHSTGHISRLGKEGKRKDLQDNYGDHRASRGEEELIAEITVALIAAEFGVEIDWGNTASYAQGWLKPLQDDPGMIIVAAKQAQDAVNWMLGIKPGDNDNQENPQAGEGVGSEGQTGEQIAEQAPTTPEVTPEPNVGEQGQTGEEIASKAPKNKNTSVESTKITIDGEEYDLWDDITYDRTSDEGSSNAPLEQAHGIFASRILDGQELIKDRNEIGKYISDILKKYGYGNKLFYLAGGSVADEMLGQDPRKGGSGVEAGVGLANSAAFADGDPLKGVEFPVVLVRKRGISKIALLHEIAHLMEAGWKSNTGGGHNNNWHQTFLTLLRQEGFQKEANLLGLAIGEMKGETGVINP